MFANHNAALDNILEMVTCASPYSGFHLVFKGKVFSCNHTVCSNCIQYSNGMGVICKKCKQSNETDITKQEAIDFSQIINSNIDALQAILLNETNNSVKLYMDSIQRVERKIDLEANNLVQQLFSIYEKADLNMTYFHETLKTDIKYAIANAKKCLSFDKTSHDDIMKRLAQLIQTNGMQLADYYKYNTTLLGYYRKLKELLNFDDRIELLFSPQIQPSYDPNEMSQVICDYETLFGILKSTRNISVFEINCVPRQMMQLNNDQVALLGTISTNQNHLNLFDFTTNPINFVFKQNINLPAIKSMPMCMTCDTDMLYVFASNQESLANYHLLCIPLHGKAKRPASVIPHVEQFADLLAYDGLLYACIQNEPKLLAFELDSFKIVKEHNLPLLPLQVQIIHSVACMRSSTPPMTIFYNLDTSQVISQYKQLNSFIFVFNRKFYTFQNHLLHMFSERGLFLKSFSLSQDFHTIYTVLSLNDNIVFCMPGKFVIFHSDNYIRKHLYVEKD